MIETNTVLPFEWQFKEPSVAAFKVGSFDDLISTRSAIIA
jgi:hypothetical protein